MRYNRKIPLILLAGASLMLSTSTSRALSIVVDVDPVTPGIQGAYAVPLGSPAFPVDVYVIGDGATVMSSWAYALEFNDTPGVLGLAGPTTFDPTGLGAAGAMVAPTGLLPVAGGPPLVPGAALPVLASPLSGAVGPGGPFTATDAGSGAFDAAGTMFGGAPAPAGVPVLLTSTLFVPTALGVSDVAAIGMFLPGPFPPGTPEFAALAVAAVGAPEVYDAPTGVATFTGASPAPFGMIPGAITVVAPIVPEPSTALPLMALVAVMSFLRRKKMPA